MITMVDPGDFADVTNRVNCLVSAFKPAAVKLVTLGLEDWLLADHERLKEVPSATN